MIGMRYQLGEIIGSGGMSEVYAADDVFLGRPVAIKMLRPDMARDEGFRERFRREAQNSARLNHPNIVAVFDIGEDTRGDVTVPYIVMERIHGRTLRDVIRNDGALPAPEAAKLLQPVAEALQASHEAGIIHRDIKPANIMLTNTGQIKVMDFGIARALDDSTSAMTQTAAVIGTAQYLSPEQARGKPADARSDVYALGCVLYETLTGRTPFEGETPFAVAYQHVQEEPTPPSELIDTRSMTPTAKVNIDAVVLTAMAKHRGDRYQSAYEMSEDLGRLAAGQVTHAARAHVPQAPATSTMAVITPTTGAHRAPVTHDEVESPARRSWLKVVAIILAIALSAVISVLGWDFYRTWQDTDGDGRSQQSVMEMIPEVRDLPAAEAQQTLEDLGFVVSLSEDSDPDIAQGRAIRTTPAAGSDLARGATITLTVSTGREMVRTPDIKERTLEDAAAVLSAAGLELDSDVIEEPSSEVEAGRIISQSPDADEPLARGSRVRVTVSTGEERVLVPRVSGMNWEQAAALLRDAGFEPELSLSDALEPENQVLRVEAEGTEVPKGTRLQVEVSNNMLFRAPNLLRRSETNALNTLREAGWRGNAAMLQRGENIATPLPTDGGLIGWASVNQGDIIRKDATIEVRYWQFSLLGN